MPKQPVRKSTEKDKALIAAARDGRADGVKALLEGPEGANARAHDEHGRTALIHAAVRGHAECVKLLLARSFVPKLDEYRLSALHWAATGGHAECVRLLIPRSRPNATKTGRASPIECAAEKGETECVRVLLASSDARHHGHNGRTALMLAAGNGHVECVRLLLAGSDGSAADEHGRTALMHACGSLLEYTPQSTQPCVEALLPISDPLAVSVHPTAGTERTAFDYAVLYGRFDCADALASFMPREAVEKAYAGLSGNGPDLMPRWAASLEAEALRNAAFPERNPEPQSAPPLREAAAGAAPAGGETRSKRRL